MQPALRIAAIGELLWDLLPDGPRLGGAPANFAAMCANLAATEFAGGGGEIFLVSRVGNDSLGQKACDQLAAHPVKLDHISIDSKHATGTVTVRFDSDASPTYEVCRGVAWDYIPETTPLATLAPALNAVCFGTLAQRSDTTRRTLRAFVEGTQPDCLRVFDVNLRDPHWTPEVVQWGCSHATILKMNHEEVPRVARSLGLPLEKQDALETGHALLRKFPMEMIAISRGAKGSLLITRNATNDHPGIAAHVVDPIGAGDAFTAALTLSVLRGLPLPLIAETANRWGAWAATQRGGMPKLEESGRGGGNLSSK